MYRILGSDLLPVEATVLPDSVVRTACRNLAVRVEITLNMFPVPDRNGLCSIWYAS